MDRDEQILNLKPVVVGNALYLWRGLPAHAADLLEDLIHAGWVGAIHAVDRRDPRMPRRCFEVFAQKHIRGSMLDYLRSIDTVPRCERRRMRAHAGAAVLKFDDAVPISPASFSGDHFRRFDPADPASLVPFERIATKNLIEHALKNAQLTGYQKQVVKLRFSEAEPGWFEINRQLNGQGRCALRGALEKFRVFFCLVPRKVTHYIPSRPRWKRHRRPGSG